MYISQIFDEKSDGCEKNPEKLSSTKVGEFIQSGFSKSTISSFKEIENKPDVYRDKDCMKKFCESLRQQIMKITNFKTKMMKLFTNEQQKSYENAKIFYTCKEKFEDKYNKYHKVRDYCHYLG